jgi:hypothetical protein
MNNKTRPSKVYTATKKTYAIMLICPRTLQWEQVEDNIVVNLMKEAPKVVLKRPNNIQI